MIRFTKGLIALFVVLSLVSPVHAAEKEGKVDLNKASVEELVKLPRVGPAVAQRVVEYRKVNGGFRKLEDLMNVKGIGAKTFEVLKDKVTVGEPAK